MSAANPNAKIVPLSSAILNKKLQLNPMANRAIIQAKNKKNGTIRVLQKVPSSQIMKIGIRQLSTVQTVIPGSVIRMLRPATATQPSRQTLKTTQAPPPPRPATATQPSRQILKTTQAPPPPPPRPASSVQALPRPAPRPALSYQSPRPAPSTQILRTAPSIQSARPALTKSAVRSPSTTGTSQAISPSITRHLPPTTIRLASSPPASNGTGNYGYHTSPKKIFQPRTVGTIPGPSLSSPSSALSRVAIQANGNKIKLISVNNRQNVSVPRRIIKNVNNNNTKP